MAAGSTVNSCGFACEECDVVIKGIFDAVSGFTINTPLAQAARDTASSILKYCGEGLPYPSLFCTFSQNLILQLRQCLTEKKRTFKQNREFMWGSYHIYRTSESFQQTWVEFVQQSVQLQASPLLYQHITQQVFKSLIRMKYPAKDAETEEHVTIPLTWEEENALRYVAGYVIRKIKSKLDLSTFANKEEMIGCITEMYGDESDEERGTESWTNIIDRGGLWHMNDLAYNLFHAFEDELRTHFRPSLAGQMADDKIGECMKAVNAVMNNEEALFYWAMIAASTEDANADVLLKMIVELYVTIRGFSFATSCVEFYKQSNKKTLQKGKGVRKELYTYNIK